MAEIAGFNTHNAPFFHCHGLRRISAESALKYHRAFGIPLSDLRPDLWPPEPSGQQPYRHNGGDALAPGAEA